MNWSEDQKNYMESWGSLIKIYFVISWKEGIYLSYMIYEVTDLQNGKRTEGTIAVLSRLTGASKSMINKLARENKTYKKRFKFRLLPEEVKRKNELKSMKGKWIEQWTEVCQIYSELKAGKRNIRRAADGKLYAMKVKIRKSV